MSTSARVLIAAFVVWCLSAPGAARAQIEGLDEFADMVAQGSSPHWKGQRVPWPEPHARPSDRMALQSSLYPLAVHTQTRSTGLVLQAMQDLERFAAFLDSAGLWARPVFDGMLGGSSDFDVYLVHQTAAFDTIVEDRDRSAYLDSATSFALVDADLAPDDMRVALACAYAEAVLIALDPAESPNWRHAFALWLAWQWSGQWSANQDAFMAQASDASTAPIAFLGDAPRAEIDAGAVWVALLSAVLDDGTGDVISELLNFARQRTWDGVDLRGSPDLWAVIGQHQLLGEQKVEDLFEQLAVARYLVATSSPSRNAGLKALHALPAPQPFMQTTWNALPKHSTFSEHGLGSLGAAYARIDTRDAPVGSLLRVWAIGESGVEWKLVLLRMSADDRVLGRVSTPARDLPRAYFPLEIIEPTDHVIAIVINLSYRLPDADTYDAGTRGFRMTIDRARP